MQDLFKEYEAKREIIKSRLQDFKKINNKDLFYELCFCILTPQSSGFRADQCVQELKKIGFLNKDIDPKPILKKKIRFHNHKTEYLIEAKKNFKDIKEKLNEIKDKIELRNWLLENVKGFGLKECHHFMRNIGYENLAILDRHILKNLKKYNVIDEMPKTLTRKKYFEIEERFKEFSKNIKIPMDELDLLFWSIETGEVFK